MNVPSPSETQTLIQEATELVLAAGLAAARALGIMLVLPVFTRARMSGLIRGCVTFAMGLPCVLQIRHGLQSLDNGSRLVTVPLLGLKEVFVGLLIGFLLSLPLWSIQAVGEIIDTQRGITNPVASDDPATRGQASATAVLLATTAITIFVLAGGLESMVRGLYGSYLIWPVYRLMPSLTVQGAMAFLGLVGHIMHTTLLVAGPVLAFLLLLDVSVMILGRFAPQIKLNDVSPTIKNLAYGIIMVSYATFLVEYMGSEISRSSTVLELFEKLLK
ncbi:type III secretion system export apparatus subunit SctT [Bradyrhizobium archetypum]|uniref:Type III secretion system export apparatus subunit SctT n=1 Tax=Bradyrhizobium archetypum TaxID=2721160 RepID=A0A7Y4M529_9BRAD|nr:type III secretion system export apparatus subunit SctT [Bradyrhizobium archetypum]NOJ50146.1 type III secretion system export apparatus subunit SctT [Bradyrhizobium archetypum]